MRLKPITAILLVLLLGAAVAVAGYATTANNLIPNTTSTPTPPVSGLQLSQAQLNAIQRDMGAKGYNVTQPLKQSGGIGSGANGSTFYKGVISQDPGTQYNFSIRYNLTVEVCKDNVTANSQFSSTVSNLQESGIVGSYKSPTQWSWVTTINGIQANSSVTKSVTGPPYTITTIE
jgi:hypothetical protein